MFTISKSIETEINIWLPRAGSRKEEGLITGIVFPLGRVMNMLKLDSADYYTVL